MNDHPAHYKLAVALLLLLAAPAATWAQTNNQIARGEELVARGCIGCHAMRGLEAQVIEGVAVPSFSQIANRPFMSRERLEALLAVPHRPMSAPMSTASEIRDLAAYIMTLK